MIKKEHESGQISAALIKYSISPHGDRIATFELEYPRFIHSELMTHRVMSRNAMSSRAVPISKMVQQVRDNPATPIHFGKNQAGMQAKEELTGDFLQTAKDLWKMSAEDAADNAANLESIGAHKQLVNRVLEPYQRMKTVVTATEWHNFFYLRCHEDAQPEIKVLAELMRDCLDEAVPDKLDIGEWHIPYVMKRDEGYYIENDDYITELSLSDALKVSASCCAQVSYRLLDDSLEKALMIYDKLITSKPAHSSPFEHQACVMEKAYADFDGVCVEQGVTHSDTRGKNWSGNFKGWIQYRQIL